MPLPSDPLVLRGGCNCGAIRYRVSVPEFASRPIHFGFPPEAADDPSTPRLPLICTDHCNDCRTATSSILPSWILTPADMYAISCLPRPPREAGENDGTGPFEMPMLPLAPRKPAADSERPPYVPAHDLLRGAQGTRGTWLQLYVSRDRFSGTGKPMRTVRSFCGRCGTNLTYLADPMPYGFPDMIDVILGTVDRADLEKEWMQPERQLWWNNGIPWVKEMVGGMSGQKHPIYSPAEIVEEP